MDPASIRAFPVKRLGGKGHTASDGEKSSSPANSDKRLSLHRLVRRDIVVHGYTLPMEQE